MQNSGIKEIWTSAAVLIIYRVTQVDQAPGESQTPAWQMGESTLLFSPEFKSMETPQHLILQAFISLSQSSPNALLFIKKISLKSIIISILFLKR